MAKCRTCKAPIIWARNEKTDRLMPLNPDPDPKGNVLITSSPDPGGTEELTCRSWTKADAQMRRDFGNGSDYSDLYVSHYATCTEAKAWRDKIKRTDPAIDEWLRRQEAKA